MPNNTSLITVEAVANGHPDKIADQIADSVLDAVLQQDPKGRVACEVFLKNSLIIVGGEITTSAWVDIESLVKRQLKEIGYCQTNFGLDCSNCTVINMIGRQSPDIAQSVLGDKICAGDQGIVYGYACKENDLYMPVPTSLAQELMRRHYQVRREGIIPFLGPDAKCQLTFSYQGDQPKHLECLIFSSQHLSGISPQEIREAIMEEIIKKKIPSQYLTSATKIKINPSGRFIIGGPIGDTGLSGRKIIVDSYGGFCHHGGGAFSGKDPTKVDRSGAYMARFLAKNLVAAGWAERCEVAIAFSIGLPDPVAISLRTFGTGIETDRELIDKLKKNFDVSVAGIIERFQLQRPIYLPTATFGHFGRPDINLPWEKIDRIQ